MIATVRSATILGARGHPVSVEVHVAKGIPGFAMLGLPDESCREARDRVRAAIITSGFGWPDKKITVNLAPPSYRKSGSGLDLPIAVGLLVAFDVIPFDVVRKLAFVGELGLDGTIRQVPGIVPMVGVHPDGDWVVPADALAEARIVGRGLLRPIDKLDRLVEALSTRPHRPGTTRPWRGGRGRAARHGRRRGRPSARSALEAAAAGGHHLLFVGPPGAGKTMLARRLPALCPISIRARRSRPMIHSASGVPLPGGGLVTRPPFRAPHHELVAVPGWRRVACAFALVRSRSLTAACCSSTRWVSFHRRCSTACARRWSWGASWSAGSRAIGCRCRLDSS